MNDGLPGYEEHLMVSHCLAHAMHEKSYLDDALAGDELNGDDRAALLDYAAHREQGLDRLKEAHAEHLGSEFSLPAGLSMELGGADFTRAAFADDDGDTGDFRHDDPSIDDPVEAKAEDWTAPDGHRVEDTEIEKEEDNRTPQEQIDDHPGHEWPHVTEILERYETDEEEETDDAR